MAKINLLTIHWGKSYGAVMQTYATCKLLEAAGHKVTVINLIHPNVSKYYKTIRNCVHLCTEFQFWLFKKRFFSKMTRKGYNIHNIELPEADITVVGSDQVWNYDITSFFGHTYYLDFVPSCQKRVSFCSSFGKTKTNYPLNYLEKTKDCFSKFSSFSVRESSGVDILRNDYNIESVNLIDPTLLWGNFNELINIHREESTIFRFLFNNGDESLQLSEFIATELGCTIYKSSLFSRLFASGPQSWLSHIKNSRYVITDSFHGLAMSIVFHKDFFVFCADPQKFTRLESLLHLLNLECRYIKSKEDFITRKDDLLKSIDYGIVEERLAIERIKCSNFIKDSL